MNLSGHNNSGSLVLRPDAKDVRRNGRRQMGRLNRNDAVAARRSCDVTSQEGGSDALVARRPPGIFWCAQRTGDETSPTPSATRASQLPAPRRLHRMGILGHALAPCLPFVAIVERRARSDTPYLRKACLHTKLEFLNRRELSLFPIEPRRR